MRFVLIKRSTSRSIGWNGIRVENNAMNWLKWGCWLVVTGWVSVGSMGSSTASSKGGPEAGFHENFESGLRPIWKKVEFEGETRHEIAKEGSNSVLKATAESSATGLAVKLDRLKAEGAMLSWRWKIDRVPPGGSDDKKKTFDHTGRLFVAFKTRVGPPRTINYVWANQVAVGRTFHHPSSGRSRFIVLQYGNEKAGRWLEEKRNIEADWKKLFGGDDVPEIVGLGFMTDSDGTQSKVTGWYDDIRLSVRK